MTHTLLVTGPALSEQGMDAAERRGARIVTMKAYGTPDEVAEAAAAAQAQAIIIRAGGRAAGPVFTGSAKPKIIVKHGVGVDTIDVNGATEHGIPVMITLGANAQSVAEQALGLMFAVAKSIPYLDGRIRAGHWDKPNHFGVELFGKSLGVVGLGAIGRTLISLVRPFQMTVRAFDPYAGQVELPDVEVVSSLNELLETSDFVSLHAPATEQTRGMIGPGELARMRKGSFLINTARGELIDTDALAAALASGHLGGAGLDTFAPEPPAKDNPLFGFSNYVGTPHTGANTDGAAARVGVVAVEQALDFLEGKRINRQAVVNPTVLDRI